MGSPASIASKSTCRFLKEDGKLCKRVVAPPETKCWQHASSLKHKWKSLTRNQSVAFVLVLLSLAAAVVLGVPSLYYSYRGSHNAHDAKPEGVTSPVVDAKPLFPEQGSKTQLQPARASKPKERQRPTDLGVHSPNETVTIPPNSMATFAYGNLSAKDMTELGRMEKEYADAEAHLVTDPSKLVLHDLFLTDFSSIDNTSAYRSGFT